MRLINSILLALIASFSYAQISFNVDECRIFVVNGVDTIQTHDLKGVTFGLSSSSKGYLTSITNSNFTFEFSEISNFDTQSEFFNWVDSVTVLCAGGGYKSLGNSSNDTLGVGGEFIGTAELNGFSDVMFQVSTDQDGEIYAEFSLDGQNWDTSLKFNYRTDRINPPHVLVKGARYFRLRFDNTSGVTQTYFRCGVFYGQFNKLTAPVNGTLAEVYDAIPTRPTDYGHEVASGKRQGHTTWNKFGFNNDVDTGGEEIIASFGGTYVPPTTAETLTIVSTDADDDGGGNGLNSVVITGIDANRLAQVEIVTLDGLVPVVTTGTWLGINRVAPFLCGSSQTNEGTITITNTLSGNTLAEMPIGGTVTEQAIFHVQDNHTFIADWLYINAVKLTGAGGSPVVTVRGWVYSPVANANILVFKTQIDTQVENTVIINPQEPFPITENSVLYFTAETDKDNTVVDMRFSGIEKRNE